MNEVEENKYIEPILHILREKGFFINKEETIKLFKKCPGTSEMYWFSKGMKAVADLIQSEELPD